MDKLVSAASHASSRSAAIRAGLDHPVIDSDGHILEFEAAVIDNLVQIAGPKVAERFRSESYLNSNFGNHVRNFSSQFATLETRRDERIPKAPWWGLPTKKTLDRAAASLPGLLYERLPETGLDFTVLYPTFGLYTLSVDDEELRRASCRAVNIYNAEAIQPFSNRMTGAAVIPMHSPAEAIVELEFAIKELKFKVAVLQSHVARPVPKIAREYPEIAHYTTWLDNYGVDSQYDYDPVWAKCVELGVSPTFHTPNYVGTRSSVTNWMHNHMGVFASGAEGVARSLFMGGVPYRFPTLRFGFLEGGVGWAANLYADIVGHWKKRNRDAISDYDPANLDQALLLDLFRRYGGKAVEKRLDRVGKSEMNFASYSPEKAAMQSHNLDEFAACGVDRLEDIKNLFVGSFYFGCEADDPMNAAAFNRRVNPMGARLNALLSSDIGHFDVPDITNVLEEAYELVEHELMSAEDFRDFTFANPARFWTAGNRNFFNGTSVAKDVERFLSGPGGA